jgi:hypothetical protein
LLARRNLLALDPGDGGGVRRREPVGLELQALGRKVGVGGRFARDLGCAGGRGRRQGHFRRLLMHLLGFDQVRFHARQRLSELGWSSGRVGEQGCGVHRL